MDQDSKFNFIIDLYIIIFQVLNIISECVMAMAFKMI